MLNLFDTYAGINETNCTEYYHDAQISKDMVLILQALVILFVAAEAMFRGPINRFGFLRGGKASKVAAGGV